MATDSAIATAKQRFPVWKTIQLGVHKNAGGYRKALGAAKNKIGDVAKALLDSPEFVCAGETLEINLYVLSVRELGFKRGATYKDICDSAFSSGLKFCPEEVGPALRLAYQDQPRGQMLLIAMKAIFVRSMGRHFVIFEVHHHEGNLWLYGNYGRQDFFYGPDDLFVFTAQ